MANGCAAECGKVRVKWTEWWLRGKGWGFQRFGCSSGKLLEAADSRRNSKMKYVDYAFAWIVFAAGVVGLVATEVRHPQYAVLDTPLLWIFVAMFNLLRLRNDEGVRGLNISCLGANLATLALEAMRFKMSGLPGLVTGLPILGETIFSARTAVLARPRALKDGPTPTRYHLSTFNLKRGQVAAPVLHICLFTLTWVLYWIQQQPLLDGPSRWPFAVVFLADLPISVVAFGVMFGSEARAPYALAAWGVLGTLWWYFLGLLIEVKVSLNRRR